MFRNRCRLLALAVLLLPFPMSAQTPSSPQLPKAERRFAALEQEYAVYLMSRFPVVATYLGGSAFDPQLARVDGRLRDYSAVALQREDARWRAFRTRFAALDPGELSPRRRIDRAVALAEIEFLLHEHEVRRHQERSVDSYVDEPFRGIDWQIQGMTRTSAATYGTDAEWRDIIQRARAIPAYMAVAQEQLDRGVQANNTPDWRVLVEFGLSSTLADAEYFSSTLPHLAASNIASASRESLLHDLGAACVEAADAYRQLHEFVAKRFFDHPETPTIEGVKAQYRADRFAFGEQEYDWALRNNLRLETTVAELFAQSWAVVESTRAAMVLLAREIASSHHWPVPADDQGAVRAVFERLSSNAPKSDSEMVAGYRDTGVRLVSYARDTGLFEVPQEYRLDVTETPPPLRSSIEGAAYYPAPPFKKTGVGRFYVTPTGNDLAELRQEHNYAAMADLAAHEGFPGHDWHYKVMTEHREEISPVRWLTPGAVEDSSSMWQDSMAAEGWALYSESLLSEPQKGAPHGFYSPEEHLYQLRGKLYRDLRVRIDTGIHTGRMQFDAAVTLFSEVVDFLPGSCQEPAALAADAKRASCEAARHAITRYSRWPTQAITYRLGMDQIVSLRRKAQQQLGPKFSLETFHLQFMKQGTVPAGYFGDELLDSLRAAGL